MTKTRLGCCASFYHVEAVKKVRFLKDRFSRIFSIAQSRNILIEDAYRMGNGNIGWSINVVRSLNGWEIREYEDMLMILSSQQIRPSPYKFVWILEKKEGFTVSSYYRFLMEGTAGGFLNFLHQQIWKTKAPPRVAFFAREACWEKIFTIDKLKRRGQILVNGCYLCFKAEEFCYHILLWCPIAYSLWCTI